MKSPLRKIKNLFRNRYDYQKKRRVGTEERWRLIEQRIVGAQSLLDIGCNTGLLTGLAAQSKMLAIGLEANKKAVATARRNGRDATGLAFMEFLVTPESVNALPTCDVVLCLSVYHQWHRYFGHEKAQLVLRTLGTKARRTLFFEPASKQSKYGTTPPAFTDHDERSIVDYNLKMLGGLFGEKNVSFIAATPAGHGEPFRYLFAVQTQTA